MKEVKVTIIMTLTTILSITTAILTVVYKVKHPDKLNNPRAAGMPAALVFLLGLFLCEVL